MDSMYWFRHVSIQYFMYKLDVITKQTFGCIAWLFDMKILGKVIVRRIKNVFRDPSSPSSFLFYKLIVNITVFGTLS